MKTQREFLPLDEWIYLKIYCGPLSIDILLRSVVKNLLCESPTNVHTWFFLRYKDQDSHLRIRFKLKQSANTLQFIEQLNELLKDHLALHRVWKVQHDTYKRELERYQFTNYDLTEFLFHKNSLTYLDFIEELSVEETKLFFTISSTLKFIQHFYSKPNELLEFLSQNEQAFKKEFKLQKTGLAQLSKKYREMRPMITQILQEECALPVCKIVDQYMTSITPILSQIDLKKNKEHKFSFVSGHIHLNINRCFIDSQRLYEMIAYDFMFRYYRSYLKRGGVV